jgi:serine/threonine-protein kinase RsbW
MVAEMKVPADFGVSDGALTELVIPSDLRSAKQPEEQILREVQERHYDEQSVFAIKLALEEALTNAIRHGNRNDRRSRLTIRYAVRPDRTVISVRDEGQGFEPDSLPDPTADENLEVPNGRGIMLMYAYMTKIRFNDQGNEVWMLKVPGPAR